MFGDLMITVKKIMSTNVVSVGLDDSLGSIKEIFENTKFHHLLVVELGKLFGVISDRDLLKALSPNIGGMFETDKDLATLNKKAHQIASRKLITLSKEATILDAISVFNSNNISCIPIVDDENKPIGIVSWRDIMVIVEKRLTLPSQNAN